MKKYILYLLAIIGTAAMGCQKELSFEGAEQPAEGSLQADISGDCLPKTVNGTYAATAALVPGTNTITVDVNVSRTGTYTVYTDTVNGYYFRGTGTFTALGIHTVTLRGNGTPFAAGVNNFVVNFDSTECDIQVTVLPAGAGGPAAFTLQGTGTPVSCSGATPTGTYIIGTALNSTNKVTLSVNVTTIGSYSITTTANGMTFSKINGAFTSTGIQNITLDGSGTPAGTPGPVNFTVTAGASTCGFQLTTVAGAAYTINCPNVTVNGTYTAGTPLNASNTITLPVTVTTGGPYTITASVNGMTFSASGTLALSDVSITLTSTGQPASAGDFSITVNGCLINIHCDGPAGVDWQFNIGPTLYSGTTKSGGANYTPPSPPGGPGAMLIYEGTNTAGNDFVITLIKGNNGDFAANDQFKTDGSTIMLGQLVFFGTGITLSASPFDIGVNLDIKITSHNTTTKVIQGDFSGTAKNTTIGAPATITNGKFTARY